MCNQGTASWSSKQNGHHQRNQMSHNFQSYYNSQVVVNNTPNLQGLQSHRASQNNFDANQPLVLANQSKTQGYTSVMGHLPSSNEGLASSVRNSTMSAHQKVNSHSLSPTKVKSNISQNNGQMILNLNNTAIKNLMDSNKKNRKYDHFAGVVGQTLSGSDIGVHQTGLQSDGNGNHAIKQSSLSPTQLSHPLPGRQQMFIDQLRENQNKGYGRQNPASHYVSRLSQIDVHQAEGVQLRQKSVSPVKQILIENGLRAGQIGRTNNASIPNTLTDPKIIKLTSNQIPIDGSGHKINKTEVTINRFPRNASNMAHDLL